jgi:hypothetical protein
MGGTMTGRRESPARLGDLSTTNQIVLHSLRVTNSSGDQKQVSAAFGSLFWKPCYGSADFGVAAARPPTDPIEALACRRQQ